MKKIKEILALESPIVNAYKKQLDLIKSAEKRRKLENLLRTAAHKNISGQASSTGKYHPKFANSEFGLSKHTKAVVRIVQVICTVFEELDPDVMIIAAIAHDMFKYGSEDAEHTSWAHAKDAGMALHQVGLKDEARLVYCHMGNFDKKAAAPKELDEKLLHLADYIASQKFININFDKDHNLLEEDMKSFMQIFREAHPYHDSNRPRDSKKHVGMPKYIIHNDYLLEKDGKEYCVVEYFPSASFNKKKHHYNPTPIYSHWLEDKRLIAQADKAVKEYEEF